MIRVCLSIGLCGAYRRNIALLKVYRVFCIVGAIYFVICIYIYTHLFFLKFYTLHATQPAPKRLCCVAHQQLPSLSL